METPVCFHSKVIHTPQKYCMSTPQCHWWNYVAVDIAEGMVEAYWKFEAIWPCVGGIRNQKTTKLLLLSFFLAVKNINGLVDFAGFKWLYIPNCMLNVLYCLEHSLRARLETISSARDQCRANCNFITSRISSKKQGIDQNSAFYSVKKSRVSIGGKN